ncbi:hypothetical protein HOLleu_44293 [Holothuria leucospilota]|uniref:Transposase domain-containing protein n=1 Tax=Holothuria leucospilota TaxID=206669 RepID=A0A9Q0YG05_HOLLE|nr:hypothetical protein HOLleu_44293 [Holothuria leucospilota]
MAFKVSDRQKRRRINKEVDQYIENIEREVHTSIQEGCAIDSFHLEASESNEPNESGTDSDSELESNSDGEDMVPPIESSSSESDEYSEDDVGLTDGLAKWAVEHNISHAAISDLLVVLKKHHPELPKDPRTFLKTTTSYVTSSISGGEYYHFGVKPGVLSKLPLIVDEMEDREVVMQVNIDGLPLFKSNNAQFWPILGMIESHRFKEPFVIGLFYGLSKPSDLDFLKEFVSDAKILMDEGFLYGDKNWKVKISAVVCDAPARAMVKAIKGHGGYGGCDKCVQHGVWLDKATFPETNAALRKDQSFIDMEDENHHLGPTPLTEVGIGMLLYLENCQMKFIKTSCFSVGMNILLNPHLCADHCQYAGDLLVHFVTHFGQLYGQNMLTYNVHGLVHLSQEVMKYGTLDTVSCFAFENYLGQLKRMVRKPTSPLEQVIRRISEQQVKTAKDPSDHHQRKLKRPHTSGPLPRDTVVTSEFMELQAGNFVVKLSNRE